MLKFRNFWFCLCSGWQKIKNSKTLVSVLRLLKWTEADGWPFYELGLISDYWFLQDRDAISLFGLGMLRKSWVSLQLRAYFWSKKHTYRYHVHLGFRQSSSLASSLHLSSSFKPKKSKSLGFVQKTSFIAQSSSSASSLHLSKVRSYLLLAAVLVALLNVKR